MDLNDLKGTSDAQFQKDITFAAIMPDGTEDGFETDIELTVRSARNPKVKAELGDIIKKSNALAKQLERPNLTKDQRADIAEKVMQNDVELAKLMLVKFSGLTQDGKTVPSNKENMDWLISDYEWIRKNITEKAVSDHAFYGV